MVITGNFGYRDHTVHELKTNHDIILNLLVTEVLVASDNEPSFLAASSGASVADHDDGAARDVQSDKPLASNGGMEGSSSSRRKPLQADVQVR